MLTDARPASRMTHSPDLPSPAHTGIPLRASLRSSLLSGLQFLLVWAWSQLWRVRLQPKPRREAKLLSPGAGAEKEEGLLIQAPGPWPEVIRVQASSSPLPWAGEQGRKEDNEGITEGPASNQSGEQKVHDGAAGREKAGGEPAGLAHGEDGRVEHRGAVRDLLMGYKAHWPGQSQVNAKEDSGEEVRGEMLPEAPGSAEQGSHSPVSSGCQGLRALAWQLREESEARKMRGAEEGNGEGGAGSQPPPVLTSPLLRAWAYRPGEDEDEDEEDVSDEGDEDEEDVSDEGDEDEEDVSDEEREAASQPPPVFTNRLLRAWAYRPGEDEDEDEEDGKEEHVVREGPGLQPFLVSIFVPGAERPPPWPSPQLPQRLKRRLRPQGAPVELQPEAPPGRKVRFSSKVALHLMIVWAGPARAARRGPWEQLARDRSRFQRRIVQAEAQLGACLCPAARARAWAHFQALPVPESRKNSSLTACCLAPPEAPPLSKPGAPPSPTTLLSQLKTLERSRGPSFVRPSPSLPLL